MKKNSYRKIAGSPKVRTVKAKMAPSKTATRTATKAKSSSSKRAIVGTPKVKTVKAKMAPRVASVSRRRRK